MTMTSQLFSLDFMSPYLLYDYIEDKRAMIKVDVLVISLSSSICLPKIVENSLSLQMGIRVPRIFTSDDMILIANDTIAIDTYIATTFNRVVEEVEVYQDFIEHSKFMGKPIKINFPFKYEPSSMEYRLEMFSNIDVDCINIRSAPQYYSVLTIALLSAKKEREVLEMKPVKKVSSPVRTRNSTKNFTRNDEEERVRRGRRSGCDDGGWG